MMLFTKEYVCYIDTNRQSYKTHIVIGCFIIEEEGKLKNALFFTSTNRYSMRKKEINLSKSSAHTLLCKSNNPKIKYIRMRKWLDANNLMPLRAQLFFFFITRKKKKNDLQPMRRTDVSELENLLLVPGSR